MEREREMFHLSTQSFRPVIKCEAAVELVTPFLLYLSAGSPPLPQWGGTPGAAPPGAAPPAGPPPAFVPPSAALHWSATQTNGTLTNGGAAAAAATSSVCESVNIPMTADSW